MKHRLRLGISACVLGERVRWDGGDKRDDALLRALDPLVEWVPVCPEMAIGLGTPREPVDLVRTRRGVRMLGKTSREDHTDAMRRWAAAHIDELERLQLHGFVLKSRSPSCGLRAVKIHDAAGDVVARGRGLFAAALVRRLATMPVEDEARLADPRRRARFLARARKYAERART